PGFPRTSVRWGLVEHTGRVAASAKRLRDWDRTVTTWADHARRAPTALSRRGALTAVAMPAPPAGVTCVTPYVTLTTLPRRPQLVTQRPAELATLGGKGR